MRTVRIEVTARDIARGEREECQNCPIARAFRRAIRRRTVRAGYGYLRTATLELVTPPEARTFMQTFDAGLPVEPFSFDLEIPDTKGRT